MYDFPLTDDKMCLNKSFNIIVLGVSSLLFDYKTYIKRAFFFHFAGVSSDPTVHSNLHPRWCHEAHHPVGPEPSTAAVWPEELRVYLLYPGERVQCHCTALQQHQHTVSEDHGKRPACCLLFWVVLFCSVRKPLFLHSSGDVISC